jgi:hypothetical protein
VIRGFDSECDMGWGMEMFDGFVRDMSGSKGKS